MKIDFTQHKLHLVITPLDMRLGFNRLYEIALVYLHIDVKILLLNAMAEKHIRAIDLAKKMGVRPQEVNRILNLKHNTKIDTIERAFNSLNLNLNIYLTKQ